MDVAGCVNMVFNITTPANDKAAFYVKDACPSFGVNQSGWRPSTFYSDTVCLTPGTYTFVMVDGHGDRSDGGTFSVAFDASAAKYDPLIPDTQVAGFGIQATFLVPSGMPPSPLFYRFG